jgi:hypothetical protein
MRGIVNRAHLERRVPRIDDPIPDHGIDLEPVPGRAGLIRLRQPLRYNPLQAHRACLLKHQLPAGVGVIVHDDADEPSVDHRASRSLRLPRGSGR